nr:hypothetical protein [Morchella crassipes]
MPMERGGPWVGRCLPPPLPPPPTPRAPTPPAPPWRPHGGLHGLSWGPPPALSVHVASTWMHPSLSEMDALPPSPSPPTTQWWGGMQGGVGAGGCSQPPSCFAADGAKQPPSCFAADGAKQPPSCFAADGEKQPPSCFAADGYGGSPRTLSSMMRGGPNRPPWGLGGLGGGGICYPFITSPHRRWGGARVGSGGGGWKGGERGAGGTAPSLGAGGGWGVTLIQQPRSASAEPMFLGVHLYSDRVTSTSSGYRDIFLLLTYLRCEAAEKKYAHSYKRSQRRRETCFAYGKGMCKFPTWSVSFSTRCLLCLLKISL